MSETAQFGIVDMVKTLNLRKGHHPGTVLVLGSRAGGLFRSERLYETLKLFGEPSFQALSRLKQFEQCYHLLTRTRLPGFSPADIDTILTEALRAVDITEADICLAELAKLGLFDMIITTNMDNMLEEALAYVGMKELHDFEIFSLRAGSEKLPPHLEKQASCRVIKVFGELTSRDYTVRRSGYLNQNPAIKQLLQEILKRDLLVIGLDPIWDAEFAQSFPAQGNSFWFVNEEQLNGDSELFQIGEARNFRHLAGEENTYHSFSQKLYELFFGTLPTIISNTYNINGVILRELYNLRYEVKKLREEIQNNRKSSSFPPG